VVTILAWAVGALLLAGLVVSIYPGELSYISGPLHRWLYDRGARWYERKWRGAAYRDQRFIDHIVRHARRSCAVSGSYEVLDLGCGTGRATRIAASVLPDQSTFVAVDFAPAMLTQLRTWLVTEADGRLRDRVELVHSDIGRWLRSESKPGRFSLVFLLEVAEFLPKLPDVLRQSAFLTAAGGGLVMTRPAGPWHLFFPGRHQSRAALGRLLTQAGFGRVRFIDWRSRYELVLADRVSRGPGSHIKAAAPRVGRRTAPGFRPIDPASNKHDRHPRSARLRLCGQLRYRHRPR
jgi:SAM-dependent methyltransferase